MNIQGAQNVAKELAELLRPAIPTALGARRSDRGSDFPHLLWMMEEVQKSPFSENKAMRWIGYAQGALVWSGVSTLREMKKLNMRYAE